MGIGRPGHRFEARDLTLITSIQVHGEDIRDQSVRVEAAPDDSLPIRSEERPAVITSFLRQSALPGAVRIHQVNFREVGWISLVALLPNGRKLVDRIRAAHRSEN